MSNPYSGLKDFQFWRRAVSRMERHLIAPVLNPKFQISRETRIATAGSCFAQHISRKINQLGFCYYVPESRGSLSEQERQRRNFGVFSARYGNIYTAQQLLQVFEEAFEGRLVHEQVWRREDGRFVNPYRPQIEPDGFDDEAEVITSRQNHLKFVRSTFLNADVLVFTLGLTSKEVPRLCRGGGSSLTFPGVWRRRRNRGFTRVELRTPPPFRGASQTARQLRQCPRHFSVLELLSRQYERQSGP